VKRQFVLLVWVRFSHDFVLYILSSGQSPPLLMPTYDRPIDRPYDRRQTYKDPTYAHFSRAF